MYMCVPVQEIDSLLKYYFLQYNSCFMAYVTCLAECSPGCYIYFLLNRLTFLVFLASALTVCLYAHF